MGQMARSGRPIAVLMSGAPGSGKSTLAAVLAERLRVPVVNKDRIRQGTLWALGTRDLGKAPPGPPLWYAVMEAHLRLEISVIGDMALFSGVSEMDVQSRLVPLADIFNVHCVARNARDRLLERARHDRIHADHVDRLGESVDLWNEQTESALDLECPYLVVDTTDGYDPDVDTVAEAIARFATSRS